MLETKHILVGLSLTAIAFMPSTPMAAVNASILQTEQFSTEYIVRFKAHASKTEIKRFGQRISRSASAKGKPVRHLKVINGFVGKINKKELELLAASPLVESIEVNQKIALPTSSATITVADMWGIDRLDQPGLPLDNSYSPYGSGNGVNAYIIDTGIRTDHIDFGGRASWAFTASDVSGGNDDDNGHGTHMAGTVGGATFGVASGVNLHAVKVLDGSGNGTLAGLLEGIEYVTNNHIAPAVAVLGMNTHFSATLNAAVEASIAAGVTYAVPAGEADKDACNYSPGSLDGAISAASTSITDRASPYSNHGPCVDIYAPGLYIKSAWHSLSFANNTISHTPMAAAHVAGAAALVLGNDPACSPAEVSGKLMTQAYNGVLTDVPGATVNRLLGVATAAGGPACTGAPDLAESCLAILEANPGATDGIYTIDPDGASGPIAPFNAFCDMTTDGGGWTGITTDIAYMLNDGTINQINYNPDDEGFIDGKPYTVTTATRQLTHYDVPLGFGFDQFYLDGYQIRGAGESLGVNNVFEIDLSGQMTTWLTSAILAGYGDIGIGSADDTSPAISLADLGSLFLGLDAIHDVSAPGIHNVSEASTALRIGWSQYGDNTEGVFPWWDGTIFVR